MLQRSKKWKKPTTFFRLPSIEGLQQGTSIANESDDADNLGQPPSPSSTNSSQESNSIDTVLLACSHESEKIDEEKVDERHVIGVVKQEGSLYPEDLDQLDQILDNEVNEAESLKDENHSDDEMTKPAALTRQDATDTINGNTEAYLKILCQRQDSIEPGHYEPGHASMEADIPEGDRVMDDTNLQDLEGKPPAVVEMPITPRSLLSRQDSAKSSVSFLRDILQARNLDFDYEMDATSPGGVSRQSSAKSKRGQPLSRQSSATSTYLEHLASKRMESGNVATDHADTNDKITDWRSKRARYHSKGHSIEEIDEEEERAHVSNAPDGTDDLTTAATKKEVNTSSFKPGLSLQSKKTKTTGVHDTGGKSRRNTFELEDLDEDFRGPEVTCKKDSGYGSQGQLRVGKVSKIHRTPKIAHHFLSSSSKRSILTL